MKSAGLDFIEAVKAAHSGKKIRRAEWVESAYAYLEGDKLQYTSPNYDEPLQVGYENVTAVDWRVIKDPPMTFMEALQHVKAGKKVRRASWLLDLHVRMQKGETNVPSIYGNYVIQNSFTVEDYEADDWVVE